MLLGYRLTESREVCQAMPSILLIAPFVARRLATASHLASGRMADTAALMSGCSSWFRDLRGEQAFASRLAEHLVSPPARRLYPAPRTMTPEMIAASATLGDDTLRAAAAACAAAAITGCADSGLPPVIRRRAC